MKDDFVKGTKAIGAEAAYPIAVVNSDVAGNSHCDILTPTSAGATDFCGAALLKLRPLKEVRNGVATGVNTRPGKGSISLWAHNKHDRYQHLEESLLTASFIQPLCSICAHRFRI